MHSLELFDKNGIGYGNSIHKGEYSYFTLWTQVSNIYRLPHNMTKATNTLIKDRAALPMTALALPIITESFFRILISF